MDSTLRDNLPTLFLMKVLTLKVPFLNGLLSLYNDHRDPKNKLFISKYLKIIRRSRSKNLKIGHFHYDSNAKEIVDLTNEKASPTCFYNEFFQFKLVMLFFIHNDNKELAQIPRSFWVPADLSFAELNPVLRFLFNEMIRLGKLGSYEIVERKIYGHEGEFEYEEINSHFLSDNYDEDNIIKVIYLLK